MTAGVPAQARKCSEGHAGEGYDRDSQASREHIRAWGRLPAATRAGLRAGSEPVLHRGSCVSWGQTAGQPPQRVAPIDMGSKPLVKGLAEGWKVDIASRRMASPIRRLRSGGQMGIAAVDLRWLQDVQSAARRKLHVLLLAEYR